MKLTIMANFTGKITITNKNDKSLMYSFIDLPDEKLKENIKNELTTFLKNPESSKMLLEILHSEGL